MRVQKASLASIIDDSIITCSETKDAEAKLNNKETRKVPTNLNEKDRTCKTQISIFYLPFLLIIITFLIVASIY